MNRSRAWHIEETDYPAVRRVMGPRRDTLDDPALEEMLGEMFPGAEPEDVEDFMRTFQQFGKQAAPLAQKALPGVIKGATQGVIVGGPAGLVGGAIVGGTAAVLSSPQRSPSPPSGVPAGITVPSPGDLAAAPPPATPPSTSTATPPAGTAAADIAQVLLLLSRRETYEGLLAMLMAAAGRSTVQVGERSVPPTEFANALAETAAIIAEMTSAGFQDSLSENLLDDQGRARCDVVNPTERALLLVTDLADVAASEAAYDDESEEEEEEEDGRWWSPPAESYDDTDPLDGYEDGLHGRAFDDD